MAKTDIKLTWNGHDVIIKTKNWGKISPYKAGLILESQAVALAPVNVERLKGSITTQTKDRKHKNRYFGMTVAGDIINGPNNENVALVGTGVSYAAAVEFGSRPHMPPIEPLRRWVNEVLRIPYDRIENKQTAWAIAMKIKKRGTKAQPFMRPAFDLTFNRMLTAFKIVGKQEFKEYFKESK